MIAQVFEGTTFQYSATIRDQFGLAIPLASLTSVTLTLFNVSDGEIINQLDGRNILNTDRGAVSTAGKLTITFTPEDTLIVGSPSIGVMEKHMAQIIWTWAGGTKRGVKELEIYVKQLRRVVAIPLLISAADTESVTETLESLFVP